jgi:uncharacterized repeat protein (TIGR03803 family)
MKERYLCGKSKKYFLLSLFFLVFSLTYSQHYVLYGLTNGGGSNDGAIFKYDPVTGKEQAIFSFSGVDGKNNSSGIIMASDGMFYGMTWQGGTYGYGTLFRFNPLTQKDSVLVNFDSANGAGWNGSCNLMQAKSGLLYGTTPGGGLYHAPFNNAGILFSYDIKKKKDSILYKFDTINGYLPCNNPTEDTSTGILYGLTEFGGTSNQGVLYSYNPKTAAYTVLVNLHSSIGTEPTGSSLLMASNGMLYGTTQYGGDSGLGVLFRYNPKTNQDTVLVNFHYDAGGYNPVANNLMQASNGLLYGTIDYGGANGDGIVYSLDPLTNKYTVLVNLNGALLGTLPMGTLVQQPGTNLLYGETEEGGTSNMGVLFCYDFATGHDSVLASFSGANGAYSAGYSVFVNDSTTGISELQNIGYSVVIYPNPCKGDVTLSLTNCKSGTSINLYNVLGELVYTKQASVITRLDIGDKPSGLYICKIFTKAEGLVFTGKLVIE